MCAQDKYALFVLYNANIKAARTGISMFTLAIGGVKGGLKLGYVWVLHSKQKSTEYIKPKGKYHFA